MKLSIVIPVYLTEATLDRCVSSVVGQTFADFEVILVDDGSPDYSPQLCDKWAQKDSRITVIHKQNGGLSDARNAALDVAKGDFVTFVDSDDWIAADTYEKVMPLAGHCDLVEYPIYCHHGSRRQYLLKPGEERYDSMGDYWLRGRAYEHAYSCNKVYRRQLFRDVRFPVGRVFEDMATLPLLLQRASSVMTTNYGCYYYEDNAQGITRNAAGHELEMLLESHLAVMGQWMDDRYYMHVLNIQLDVTRLTAQPPRLSSRCVNPLGKGLNMRLRMKALLLDLTGISTLCLINRITSKR